MILLDTNVISESLRPLPFDEAAAPRYSGILAAMRATGRAISTIDCQIAAIAATNDMIVATRDTQPFRDAGIRVINPWTEE